MSYYATSIVELTTLAIICFVALTANGTLFWIVFRKKELRTMSNLFVLNLAVADTLVSLASMPVTFLNIASSSWTFSSKVCVLFGYMTMASFISSVSSLGLIAINRYFYIVKWQTYERTFTTPRGSLCVGLVWTISLTLASPPLLGWAEYHFIPCFVYWQSDVSYMYFMVATCVFGPLSVMALPYVKMLSFTRNHKRRLATSRNRINVTREADLAPRLRMSVEETK